MISHRGDAHPIVWLHAARNGKEHAFREYVVGLAQSHPEEIITRRVWYSDATVDDVRGDHNTALYHFDGRMELAKVKPQLPLADPRALYYFCGPAPWMRSVASQLTDLGVSKD